MTIPAIALSRGPLRVDIEMPMFDSAKYNVSDHHETYGSLENMKSNQDVTDMQSSLVKIIIISKEISKIDSYKFNCQIVRGCRTQKTFLVW